MKRGLDARALSANAGLATPVKGAAGNGTSLNSGLKSTTKRGAGRFQNTQPYTPGTSLLSKLKSPAPGSQFDDNASVVSATTRSGTLAETLAEIQTTKEKLLSTLHEHTEESENFVVTASDGGQFRIMIGNKVKFGEHNRIHPVQLKKLFLHKPDIAEILYDTLVEEGIVVEETEPDHGDVNDELDALGITMEDFHLMQDAEHHQQSQSFGEEKTGGMDEPDEEEESVEQELS